MGLRYYSRIKDARLSELLRHPIIKTDNQLVVLYDYSWKYCPYTGRSKLAYIIFYNDALTDHLTNVPGPVAQSSYESEYNAACTKKKDLAHFIMRNHVLLSKVTDVVL